LDKPFSGSRLAEPTGPRARRAASPASHGLLLSLVVSSLLATACATTGAVPRPYPGTAPATAAAGRVPAPPVAAPAPAPSTPDAVTEPAARPFAEAVAAAAQALLGTPYRSGGAGVDGFDCSGFVQYVFAEAGAAVPRSVREQWQSGEGVDDGDLRPGDLVFFAIDGREVSHVGIALDGGTFVHAPSAHGVVRVEHLDADYWAKRYVGARRIGSLTVPVPEPRAPGRRP
jgi:cell wall-associated NlpC family hydrolase